MAPEEQVVTRGYRERVAHKDCRVAREGEGHAAGNTRIDVYISFENGRCVCMCSDAERRRICGRKSTEIWITRLRLKLGSKGEHEVMEGG